MSFHQTPALILAALCMAGSCAPRSLSFQIKPGRIGLRQKRKWRLATNRQRRLLNTFQAGIGVAEVIQLHTHAIHQREVQAAHLTILRWLAQIADRTSRLERSAQTASP